MNVIYRLRFGHVIDSFTAIYSALAPSAYPYTSSPTFQRVIPSPSVSITPEKSNPKVSGRGMRYLRMEMTATSYNVSASSGRRM